MTLLSAVLLVLITRALLTVVHGAGYATTDDRWWPINPNGEKDAITGMYTVPMVTIPYFRAYPYNIADFQVFTNAINTISATTKNCIRFVPGLASTPNVLTVSAKDPLNGSIAPVCRGPLGYSGTSQNLVLISQTINPSAGRAACLHDARDVTRMLLNVLGVVNEFQRPDRGSEASPMKFPPNYPDLLLDAIRDEGLFNQKTAAETVQLLNPDEFDMASITMVDQNRYAKVPNGQVFSLSPGQSVSTGTGLSQLDCEVLKYMYACDIPCEASGGQTDDFDQATVSQSYFCWPEAGSLSTGESPKPIDSITTKYSGPNPINKYEIIPPLNYMDLTIPDLTKPETAQFRLTRHIKNGYTVSALVHAKSGSTTVASGTVEVKVNCWPQFKLSGDINACGVPGETGEGDGAVAGRECRRTETYTAKVQCSDGSTNISPYRRIVTLATITDPEGTPPEFLVLKVAEGLSTSGTDATENFIYVQTTRTVMATAAVPVGDYTFSLIFIDPGYEQSAIAYIFTAEITCS